MSDLPQLQRTADRALEMADEDHLSIVELRREIKMIGEELGYLKTFNGRLLEVLKLQFHLDDQDLDALLKRVGEAQEKVQERPGHQVAPLCTFCGRPLQLDNDKCIYCGRKHA